jgi:hypothetical protein
VLPRLRLLTLITASRSEPGPGFMRSKPGLYQITAAALKQIDRSRRELSLSLKRF